MTKFRNEHAIALRMRAGNAGVAIAVDTRPKIVGDKKKPGGRAGRRAAKADLRKGAW